MSEDIRKNVEKWNRDLNKISTTIGEIKHYLKSNDLRLNQLIDEGLIDPIDKIESIKGKIDFLKDIGDEECYFMPHTLWDINIYSYKDELNKINVVYSDIISPLFTDENIDRECEELGDSIFDKCMEEWPYGEDGCDTAGDQCAERALSFVENRALLLYLMKYVNRCLWISGLVHTWEQQLIRFHKDILLEDKNFNLKFEDIKQSFKRNLYDFEDFESYNTISELRLVVNTIKHGEGFSSDKLRKICPKYFKIPNELGYTNDRLSFKKTTLLEETLFITDEDFKRYFKSLISFWDEMFERNKEIWEEIESQRKIT